MANPRRRVPGPGGGGTAKNVLALWTILFLLAAAQPQSANSILNVLSRQQQDLLSSTIQHAVPQPSRRAQPSRSPAEILPLLDTDTTNTKRKSTEILKKDGDSFLAIAPAHHDDAVVVRAPLARSGEPSTRLSSLSTARSLQDWEVENIVLLATVDGAIHARDRKTGQERWALIPDSPMIQTTHHRAGRSDDDDQSQDDEYIFIVEPSKDGSLYIQYSDPKKGLQKLDATVREKALNTPFVDDPGLIYIADKETSMYTIDAASGNVMTQFDMRNMFVNDNQDKSCRRVSDFELDQPDREPIGTLNLGRVTYTIKVYSTVSRDLLCTIKYSEWTPNTRDGDLQTQHVAPLDRYHIQTFHDGRITGWDLEAPSARAPRFTHVLETPVARVFDVVRPANDQDNMAPLVILSQPLDPLNPRSLQEWENTFQPTKVYVNQTGGGHWYAMSELSYPGVTNSATLAKRFTGSFGEQELLNFDEDMDDLIGVHVLTPPVYGGPPMPLAISAGSPKAEVALPPESHLVEGSPSLSPAAMSNFEGGIVGKMIVTLTVMFLGICLFALGLRGGNPVALRIQDVLRRAGFPLSFGGGSHEHLHTSGKEMAVVVESEHTDLTTESVQPQNDGPVPSMPEDVATSLLARSRSATASDIGLPADDSQERTSSSSGPAEVLQDTQEQSSDGESDDDSKATEGGIGNGSTEPKKKKTKRGRRGGKNNKKKKTMSPEALDGDQSILQEVALRDGVIQIGKITFDANPDRCLGHGSNGTAVFPGHLGGREVAVKRLIRSANSLAAKEIKHLLSSDENPHVIRYFDKEESLNFTYLALDRFEASLDQVVEHMERYPSLVATPKGLDVKDALQQITDGVSHLHALKLVHRDIKPQNVLVRATKSSRPLVGPPKLHYVISDFGLCKPLDEGPESTFAPTANRTAAGTTGWRAPELLVDSRASVAAPAADSSLSRSTTHSSEGTVVDRPSGRRATKAIDIFSLGCVFYYVMTQGRHPFDVGGSSLGRDLNIKENRFSTDDLRLHDYQYDADDLIRQMLMHDPRHRPDTLTVLRHPYFWDVATKLDFLCEISDQYEHEKNTVSPTSDEMLALEAVGPNVIGPSNDFTKALPKNFFTEMGKQRKYSGNKMVDLLRAIRNKRRHLTDLPDVVKEYIRSNGGSDEGYYRFWMKRFPSLLVNCHCLVMERDLLATWELEKYFN
jgi:serine/threonine-protein kinase/endoribonuclease IRE1